MLRCVPVKMQVDNKFEQIALNKSPLNCATNMAYEDSANQSQEQTAQVGPHIIRNDTCTSEKNGFSSISGSINSDGKEKSSEGSGNVSTDYHLYKRRWYVLLMYCMLAGTQGGVWNTFGPIAATAEEAFEWNDGTIALMANWGPIAYLPSGLIFSWMMDVKGLKLSCIVTAFLIAVGCALRCITMEPPAVTWLIHTGQFFNGLGGPIAMAAPPVISAVWFPPHERTTATAIAMLCNSAGTAAAYIVGPYIVPDVPKSNSTNESTYHLGDLDGNQWLSNLEHANSSEKEQRIANEKTAIHLYMYIVAGWSIFLFLLFLIYFPNKPPLPPCATATIQRENFLAGLKSLMKNKEFWLLALVYGMTLGTLGGWSSVLDVILKPQDISEVQAGWIGFYATCSSCILSLIVGRFADLVSRVMKWLLLGFITIATGAMVVFSLSCTNIIPPYTAIFYAMTIISYTVLNASCPLIYELGCELAYPTGEGTANGVMTIVNNVFGLIFLFIMMKPNIGTMWTNWTFAAACFVSIPVLLLMKENYKRLEIDEKNPTLASINQDIVVLPP